MTDAQPGRRYRFGVFEANTATGELRRQGLRVRLNAQPFQLLLILLERPGGLVTREEISRRLWPDGTFVDSDHGLNSAVNRIREALGDNASNPRFVETLARRGYRFIAPVEQISPDEPRTVGADEPGLAHDQADGAPEAQVLSGVLASPHDLPKASGRVVQTLFVLMQLMYIGFYVGALANLGEIEELLLVLPKHALIFNIVMVTAAILIPARAFLLSAWVFRAPRMREKFMRMWPFLLLFDLLWSLSPFLLLHHINFGLALSCTALLVYAPFAQRSLVLMGAMPSHKPSVAEG